jgi:hypothetical protein
MGRKLTTKKRLIMANSLLLTFPPLLINFTSWTLILSVACRAADDVALKFDGRL